MSTLKERAEKRRRTLQVQIQELREAGGVYTTSLSPETSLELVAKLSKEAWYLQTGCRPDNRVDKSIVTIRSLKEPCI
jgi:hypothetical protein